MSTENQAQENKMGVMPENRLLLTMAIPIVISMLVQALYNVVDSVFVAQLSEDALNAVSLAFPVQNLMIAVAVGTGVGINALLSKSLGEGNQAKADRTAMNGLFLSALSFLVFAVIGLTCSPPVLHHPDGHPADRGLRRELHDDLPVSYTHLTLPTNSRV